MNDDVKVLTDLDRLCRTCLSEKNGEELRSLFSNSLETQLTEITAVRVEQSDGLPSNICNDCYFTLNIALNFKDQCQKSESQLRSALYPGQTIIYRSITILGDNSDELQIQNFEELDPNLPLLKDSDVISNGVQLAESIEITSNFDNIDTGKAIYLKADIPPKQDIYNIATNVQNAFENIYCNNVEVVAPLIEKDLLGESVQEQGGEVHKSVIQEVERENTSIFKCTDCEETFTCERSLKLHLVKHESKFRCEICDQEFNIIKYLNDHLRTHTDYIEEFNPNLPPLKVGVINNEDELTESIEITSKYENGETESETIYLKTEIPCKKNIYNIETNVQNDFDNLCCNNINVVAPIDVNPLVEIKQNQGKEVHKSVIQEVENRKDVYIFKCTYCDKTFRYERSLRLHLVKHGSKLQCEVCGQVFNVIKKFNDHLRTHTDYRPYECKVCAKTFSMSNNLVKHMRVHNGEKRHLCTICGKRFYEPNHLKIHTRTHTGEKPMVCNICGKRFSDQHGLTIHNKVHTGERKYQCNFCGKRFAHSFVLKAHKRTHTGEKPYTCKTCGASFGTSSYLTIHNRTHTQERPYKCEACPKSFISKCGLVAHQKIHTGEKKFQCAVCGKRMGRAADLQIHMRSHTGEKPYACDQCPKRYHTSSNLATHKRTHLGIKDQVCTICGKAFGDSRTLKCHYRTHTGEKPYICACGKSYTQSGQFAGHRKTCQLCTQTVAY